MPVFTVDYEHWLCFKPYGQSWEETDLELEEPTDYLLDLLRRHNIKAIFYVLGWLRYNKPELIAKIEADGHVIGDHTFIHEAPDIKPSYLFRSPRWNGERRLLSGGFWLRAMPYWWIKREVDKEKCLFVHPHDIMLGHPDCGNLFQNLQRDIGLKTARDKLERLCRETTWENAKDYFYATSGD